MTTDRAESQQRRQELYFVRGSQPDIEFVSTSIWRGVQPGMGAGGEDDENRLERIRVLGVLRALTPDTATYKKAKVLLCCAHSGWRLTVAALRSEASNTTDPARHTKMWHLAFNMQRGPRIQRTT